MMKKLRVLMRLLILMLSASYLMSCMTTKYFAEYANLDKPEPIEGITVLTKDGKTYYLDTYKIADSSIIGLGTYELRGSDSIMQFKGKIEFSDIKSVSVGKINVVATIGIIAGALLVAFIIGIGTAH
ncbi:MAG: hypothetical protein K1X85_01325 [Ignavibacteria bacterium]|nr:hypothetical protein [Ignavibacteria bacterium]